MQSLVSIILLTTAHRNAHKILLRKSGDVLFEGLDRDAFNIIMYLREIESELDSNGLWYLSDFPDLVLAVADI
jgi:hypothetical protein